MDIAAVVVGCNNLSAKALLVANAEGKVSHVNHSIKLNYFYYDERGRNGYGNNNRANSN